MPPIPNSMNTVAFYDTKPYDREYFERATEAGRLRRQHEALSEIARVTTANLIRLGEGQPFPEESVLVSLPVPPQANSR